MLNRQFFRTLAILAGMSVFSALTWAAGGEVAGFGGAQTLSGGAGTHGFLGASVAKIVGDKARVFGEFGFVPSASSQSAYGVSLSERIVNFGGGVAFDFGSSSRARPYVLGAVGAADGLISQTGTAPPNVIVLALGGGISFYEAAGGGVRLYVGKSWGIKPEVRYEHYNGSNAVIYTGGVFFEFGK